MEVSKARSDPTGINQFLLGSVDSCWDQSDPTGIAEMWSSPLPERLIHHFIHRIPEYPERAIPGTPKFPQLFQTFPPSARLGLLQALPESPPAAGAEVGAGKAFPEAPDPSQGRFSTRFNPWLIPGTDATREGWPGDTFLFIYFFFFSLAAAWAGWPWRGGDNGAVSPPPALSWDLLGWDFPGWDLLFHKNGTRSVPERPPHRFFGIFCWDSWKSDAGAAPVSPQCGDTESPGCHRSFPFSHLDFPISIPIFPPQFLSLFLPNQSHPD